MKNVGRIGIGIVAMALLFGRAEAADLSEAAAAPVPVPVANDWRFQATFYGWMTGINGDVGARGLGPVHIDVSAKDALEDLDGALMASFAAQNDQLLFLGDFIWNRITSDGSVNFGLNDKRNFGWDYSQTQYIIQGIAGYKLPIGDPKLTIAPTIGFRYMYLNADINITPEAVPVTLSDGGNVQWIDPTVGVFTHYDFNDKWFVTALGDIGGFGIGSDLTWQAFGAVGYNWSKTISTSLGYRAIYEDYEHGGFVYNTTQQGVFAGLGIHF